MVIDVKTEWNHFVFDDFSETMNFQAKFFSLYLEKFFEFFL